MGISQEERQRLTAKRWLILIASCLINLCIGSMYAWSVFSAPMAEHLSALNGVQLTAADLAIVFSIGNADGFITLIGGGFINDKLGPKWVIFAGGILFGLGFVVCGLARSVAMLIVGFGLMCGLGMGLAYGCTISNSVKFFPDKRGLIGGIATASYGISSVIIPPIANALIDSMGVNTSFIIFGVATVVIVGVFSFMVEKCPVDFAPVGWNPPEVAATETKTVAVPDKDWKGMLSTPIFYIMIIMLFFGANFGMMAISQASNIAQNMVAMTAANAAIVVSVLALFNAFGRVVAGSLSDKIGRINTLTLVFVVAIVALILLFNCGTGTVLLFYIGICLIGVCFGAFMGIYPGFTADNFGTKNSSVNYGIMFIGFSAAGLIGPQIMSNIYKATGAYQMAFIVAAVMAVVGLALSFLYRVVSKHSKA